MNNKFVKFVLWLCLITWGTIVGVGVAALTMVLLNPSLIIQPVEIGKFNSRLECERAAVILEQELGGKASCTE